MMKILLSTALISFSVYATEAINVCQQSVNNTSQIQIYQSEQTLLNKLLPLDKVHNLANNIRKDKKNLVKSDEDVANIDCEIRFICYFNATMQALHASPTFREFIDKLYQNDSKQDKSYISADIKKLFDGIESGRYSAHIEGQTFGQSNEKDEDVILSKAKLYNQEVVEELAKKLQSFNPGHRGSHDDLYDEVCEKLENEARAKNIAVPYSFDMNFRNICKKCNPNADWNNVKLYKIDAPSTDHYDITKVQNEKIVKGAVSACNLTNSLKLKFNVGLPKKANCKKNNCGGLRKYECYITKLPKLLVVNNSDNGYFFDLSTPKKLCLRDSDGIKNYTLVSLTDLTHRKDDTEKTHLVASVRFKDNTWRELNDLLKDGVAHQGISVDFKEMPDKEPVRYRSMMYYEQI